MKRLFQCLVSVLLVLPIQNALAHQKPQGKAAFYLDHIRIPEIELRDHNNRLLNLAHTLSNKRVVVTFQYSTCKLQCPAGNVVMQGVQELIASRQGNEDVLLLSITLDPQNDTPSVLAEKAKDFGAGPQWLWLTGESEVMSELFRVFRVSSAAKEDHDVYFLVGRGNKGQFQRISGLPTAAQVLDALRSQK